MESMRAKKEEDPVDKYTKLLETVGSGGGDTNAMMPYLTMLMGQGGNKSMDKLYEAVAMKQVFKMLGDDDDKKLNIDAILEKMDARTDKKLDAMQKNFQAMFDKMAEMMPKPKSEESMLLEKLLEKMDKANDKGDVDEVDRLIKLITVMQQNKPQEKDPIESFKSMYEMVNQGNEKYIGLREEMLKQQNDATLQQLDQALRIIDQQKDNTDWMQKLQESTQTINRFKSFMEDSGLKPTPKTENGKVDLKYILDTVSEVVKGIAPALPAPKKNPTWDVDKEAQRLQKKYGQYLQTEDGKPLSLDFIKNELEKNPSVENQWKYQIEQALKEQGQQGEVPEPEEDDEIAKMFQQLEEEDEKGEEKETTTEETGDSEKEKPETSKNEPAPKGRSIKGMQV